MIWSGLNWLSFTELLGLSRLVEATMTRGSPESREAPDKVICLPRHARPLGGVGLADEGPRLPSGAQRDGGRTSDLANRRPAPNGRPRVHLLDVGTRNRLQTT
jgi:hypothetical protein